MYHVIDMKIVTSTECVKHCFDLCADMQASNIEIRASSFEPLGTASFELRASSFEPLRTACFELYTQSVKLEEDNEFTTRSPPTGQHPQASKAEGQLAAGQFKPSHHQHSLS